MHNGMNPYSAHFRAEQEASLTVQGEGSVQAKPDVVVLTIGIRTENESVQQAQTDNATESKQLLSAWKTLGIPDNNIETLSYTITPQYTVVSEKSVLTGYRIEHLYKITVLNVQKAGEVYEVAVANGANITGGLQFLVSHPNTYYEKALVLAVQNAQEKARTIASTYNMNINLIPTSLIEEPMRLPRQFVAYSGIQASPPIQSGELEITANVRASFTYL